jgi:phytol kinase
MRVILAALCYTALFILIELIARKFKLNKELSRKLAHIIAGTSAAFLPLVMSFHQIMVLSLLFLPVMALSKNKNLFSSIHEVNRKTYGELYFPVAIFITAWWFPTKDLFMYGVLVMGISDGLASIVGQKLGKKTYKLWQGKKSYVGSFAFFVATVVIGLLVAPSSVSLAPLLAIGLVLTLVEASLSGGIDNLILPPVASGLLMIALKLF